MISFYKFYIKKTKSNFIFPSKNTECCYIINNASIKLRKKKRICMTNLPSLYLTLLTHIVVFNFCQFNIHEVSVQIRQEAKQKIKKKDTCAGVNVSDNYICTRLRKSKRSQCWAVVCLWLITLCRSQEQNLKLPFSKNRKYKRRAVAIQRTFSSNTAWRCL